MYFIGNGISRNIIVLNYKIMRKGGFKVRNILKQKKVIFPFFIVITAIFLVYIVGVIVYSTLNNTRISVRDREMDRVVKVDLPINKVSEEQENILHTIIKPYKEKIVFQSENEKVVKEKIASIHTYLNHLTEYGKIEREDYSNLARQKNWVKMNQDLEWLSKKGVGPSKMLNDIEAARACAMIAQENNPEIGLRYLHRIFHDLDSHLNEIDTQEDWGVTQTFGYRESQEMLYQFIKNGLEAAY